MEFRIHGYAPSSSLNDDESFFAEQTGEVIDDAIYKRNLETETLLNIKLIYETSLPANDARNRIITGVMAGDDFCDICIYKSGGFGAIVTNGVLNSGMMWMV